MQINSHKNLKITERILLFIKHKGITKYKFHKDLGFSNGFLDTKREIGTDKYAKILEYLPDVSSEWLLTGSGEMLKAGFGNISGSNIISGNHNSGNQTQNTGIAAAPPKKEQKKTAAAVPSCFLDCSYIFDLRKTISDLRTTISVQKDLIEMLKNVNQ